MHGLCITCRVASGFAWSNGGLQTCQEPSIRCNLGVIASSIFTQLFYLFIFRAQNNFWTVARHDDWPKKFSLGQIWFSDQSQKKVEKREIILVHFSICDHDCIFIKSQNPHPFTGEDLVVCSRIREWVTGQHDRQAYM